MKKQERTSSLFYANNRSTIYLSIYFRYRMDPGYPHGWCGCDLLLCMPAGLSVSLYALLSVFVSVFQNSGEGDV